MNLLMVNMTLDLEKGGGSALRTIQLTRAVADLGVRCRIATTGASADNGSIRERLSGVDVLSLPATLGRFRVPYTRFAALGQAVASTDVALLMNHWTPINLVVWRAVTKAGTPYAVCPAGALPVEGRSRTLKRIYNAIGGRKLVCHADACIAVTPQDAAQFEAYGVDPQRVSVVPNSVPALRPANAAACRDRLDLGAHPVLLFLGRFAPIKGPDLLVDAFRRVSARHPEWRLVLAGADDGMLERLRRQVAAAGVGDRVRFPGFLDEQAKADALAACDLVVVPSRREAMSMAVLEAAAAHRPVLVTDTCGIPEVAESGGGWVVEPTVDAIERGLLAALACRPAMSERGERWSRYATDRFSSAAVGRQLLGVLERAVAEHRS